MAFESTFLALVVIASLYTLAQIRVVRDDERIALSRDGVFRELRGPGLILAPRFPGLRQQRIRYRAHGVIQSDRDVEVEGLALPYEALAPLSRGSAVRVVGFAPRRVHVEPTPD